MRKLVYSSSILVFLLISSFVNIHSQSLEKIRAKIEEINSKMSDDMVKGEYNASLGMYVDDAYSLPSYAPMIKGIEAIKKSSMEMANSPIKIKSFELMITEIIPGGKLYIEIGKYKMTMDMAGMPEPFEDHGKYITVWEKQKSGSLKIKVETWNSDINPWN